MDRMHLADFTQDRPHRTFPAAYESHHSEQAETRVTLETKDICRTALHGASSAYSAFSGAIGAVPEIDAASPKIVDLVEYKEGHRYQDFDPATDKKSDMSLAGMVLGGAVAAKLAAKAGFFAKFGKILIIGGIAVAAFFRKMIGRKKNA
ncbi:DUF2167 domain-containing protein [Haloferula sp.]|uniref:DUF2167 domain-containing protein n=1 Tax=Haloferula sp. TaxID=2497595 RepID=UPI00329C9AB5